MQSRMQQWGTAAWRLQSCTTRTSMGSSCHQPTCPVCTSSPAACATGPRPRTAQPRGTLAGRRGGDVDSLRGRPVRPAGRTSWWTVQSPSGESALRRRSQDRATHNGTQWRRARPGRWLGRPSWKQGRCASTAPPSASCIFAQP